MPPETLPRPLTPSEIAAYDADGIVALRRIFPSTWIETLRGAVDAAMADPGPFAEEYTPEGKPGRFFGDLDLWKRWPPFRRFAFGSPAACIAQAAMRTNKVNFFYDQLLVKEPGTTERTPWHQDQPYWAVSGRQVCSIWLPLDAVSAANGVEYVRGSHRWDREYLPYHFMDGSPYRGRKLAPLPDIESRRGDYDVVAFDLEPGDCLVFQAMIVHGAPGNASSTQRRRALSTRWTGDDARYCVRDGECAIPTGDPGLKHGDPLDSDAFPRIL
jgi:ectoine hydroxylase-related dioxygenase (phytanoyl-CoA dioxygenase family)